MLSSHLVLGLTKKPEIPGISIVAAPPGQLESTGLLDRLGPVRERVVRSLRTRFALFALEERAQSMVEIALLLPMLVFLILAGGDLARAYALQLAVQNGARAGAEAAAIDYTPSGIEARGRTMDELSRTPGLNPFDANIDVTFKLADGVTDCTVDPTVAAPCWATVRVRYTFHTVTPWPLIPNTALFDRTTTMRTIQAPTAP
jgi:Flp pilus assembly protein TadG